MYKVPIFIKIMHVYSDVVDILYEFVMTVITLLSASIHIFYIYMNTYAIPDILMYSHEYANPILDYINLNAMSRSFAGIHKVLRKPRRSEALYNHRVLFLTPHWAIRGEDDEGILSKYLDAVTTLVLCVMATKKEQFCCQLSKREQIWEEPQRGDHDGEIGEVQCGPAFNLWWIVGDRAHPVCWSCRRHLYSLDSQDSLRRCMTELFVLVRFRTNQYGRGFMVRVVQMWNSLNNTVIAGVGLSTFKSSIDTFLLSRWWYL